MSLESSCKGEFAKFVSYHIFGNIYGNMLATIVYRDCVAYEIRENR